MKEKEQQKRQKRAKKDVAEILNQGLEEVAEERVEPSKKEAIAEDDEIRRSALKRAQAAASPASVWYRRAVFSCNKLRRTEASRVPITKPSDFVVKEKIGQGTFGQCWRGQYGSVDILIKVLSSQPTIADGKEEARILTKLRHPGVPILIGVVDEKTLYKIVEVLHLFNGRPVTMSEAAESKLIGNSMCPAWLKCFEHLCRALIYLHDDARILHNDIKANNVVLEKGCDEAEARAVLIDFGKAREFAHAKRYPPKTDLARYSHLAPELSSGSLQSRASDVYSLGYTMKYVSHKLEGQRTVREIYHRCLSKEPASRPSLQKILDMLAQMQ